MDSNALTIKRTRQEYEHLINMGYVPVYYIENSDSAYIDIGLTPYEDTTAVIDYMSISNARSIIGLFGAVRTASADMFCVFQKTTRGNTQAAYSRSFADIALSSLNTRHTIALDKGDVYYDGNLVDTLTSDEMTCRYNVHLFEVNYGNTGVTNRGFVGRIYGYRQYKSDVLLRDLVPCVHNSVAGMYDMVSGTFFTSAHATDVFTAGSSVVLPDYDGRNIEFPIYSSDGTIFNNLRLRKATYESTVMSLGDKITGDVMYRDNNLAVSMQEYIEYKGVKFVLVNPPTIIREGMVSDNSDSKGMTKYSFEFYHPMYNLANIPFTDVAVTSDEEKYLSQNKTFSWSGTGLEFINKMNKNLQNTEWIILVSDDASSIRNLSYLPSDIQVNKSDEQEKSNVLSFNDNFISDALKTAYDTWEVPFVIDSLQSGEYYDEEHVDYYTQGKRFVIMFGLPSNEIVDDNGNPYIFRFGKGVGLKNNSRTPRNNKIVTRIVGYGSERNIPYGYPQIVWTGNQTWNYTINNDATAANSYPIYDGIVGGQKVRLIKHPFTRKQLMPTIYVERVNKKVNPNATGYDPTIEIIDYYDATQADNYPNPIVLNAPSVEIHGFENIKPQLGDVKLYDVSPYPDDLVGAKSYSEVQNLITAMIDETTNRNRISCLRTWDKLIDVVTDGDSTRDYIETRYGGAYTFSYIVERRETYVYVAFTDEEISVAWHVLYKNYNPHSIQWDDSIDKDGNYNQGYLSITLPQLQFDLFACASAMENMQINMRSGDCLGCTFDVYVDWEDYKNNFYNASGQFDPVPHTTDGDGHVRDISKYPNSSQGRITLVVKKDSETFGTLLPSVYQQPKGYVQAGENADTFVILGISLPQSYVTQAQENLDDTMKQYMLENNVYYFDYPLKFDEYFLATHQNILAQVRNNAVLKFQYSGSLMDLYIKQISIKYGESTLPKYDITLTDDVEIVLNKIGQVTDDVSRVRVQLSELQKYYSENLINLIAEKLSRIEDDIAQGKITFQQGLESIGDAIFNGIARSSEMESGLYTGKGWRIDQLGNAELESVTVRSYLKVVEMLINRLQAQEGDTLYTDNDQIERVDEGDYNGTPYYILSLKEKWDGYITSQKVGNVIKGIVNTLAANYGNVSDVDVEETVTVDGENSYYTSWMFVVDPSTVGETVEQNQIIVQLYDDEDVPAQKNFPPCQLMNIARWGCLEDPNAQGLTPAEKEDIERRQRMFYISVSDGRIAKLTGVRKPILEEWNYGTTLGLVPDFIKTQWQSVAQRLIEGRDYLYAQGIIVGDFIKVDINGAPLVNYVDKGEWQNNTPYLNNSYNEQTLQWETHDVWHNGSYWRCRVSQPYNGTYYEPTEANSTYWEKLMTGQKGDTVKSVNIFKWSNEQPATPTESAIPPTGWSLDPNDYGNAPDANHAGWRVLSGGRVDNAFVRERLIIESPTNTTVNIEIEASSEGDTDRYNDYIAVGNLDTPVLDMETSDDLLDNRKAGGTDSKTISVSVTSGKHFVDIVYAKDSSLSSGRDCGWYRWSAASGVKITLDGFSIWASSAVFNNNVKEEGWSTPVQWNGSDGENGESAFYVECSANTLSIACDKNHCAKSNVTRELTVKAFYGTDDVSSQCTIKETHSDGDIYVGLKVGSSFIGMTSYISMQSNIVGVITYKDDTYSSDTIQISVVHPIYGERIITLSINAQYDGQTGDKGDIGRFYYYGGAFNGSDTSQTFSVTDAEAPYFKYGGTTNNPNYWVYIGDVFTNKTMSWIATNKGVPSDNGNWMLMVTDFKYLITEAIFGSYAHFGSAIINGDWMISTNGKIDDVQYNNGAPITVQTADASRQEQTFPVAYTLFDPSIPRGVDMIWETYKNVYTQGIVAYPQLLFTLQLQADVIYKFECECYTQQSSYQIGGVYVKETNQSTNQRTILTFNKKATYEKRSVLFSVANSLSDTQSTVGYNFYFGGDLSYLRYIRVYRLGFAPNYAVNLLTGATYQENALIKGTVIQPYAHITEDNWSQYKETLDETFKFKNTAFNVQFDYYAFGTGSYYPHIIMPYEDEENFWDMELKIFNNTTHALNVTAGRFIGQTAAPQLQIPAGWEYTFKLLDVHARYGRTEFIKDSTYYSVSDYGWVLTNKFEVIPSSSWALPPV